MSEPFKLVESRDEPNMEIVHKLEVLLAQAVRGDLRAFASVELRKGSYVTTGWIISQDANMHVLNSGVHLLGDRVLHDMNAGVVASAT